MKTSNRDKTLIFAVISIAIVFVAYYFGFRTFTQKKDDIEAEAKVLQARYDELKAMEQDIDQYKSDTVMYNLMYDALLANYDTGFSQKATLLFTSTMEEEIGTWVKTVSMPDAERIYTFGNVRSTNPNSSGGVVYSTDMVGYKKSVTYSYQTSYDGFKDLLAYILDYETRYTIDSVSCSYEKDDDIMSGNITISQYAVTGSEREYTEPDIELVPTGTDNLFASTTNPDNVIDEEGDGFGIMTNYDLALSLNSEASDLSSVVLGRRGIISSQLAQNTNGNVNVTIRIEGAEGLYYMQYSVGNKTYPAGDMQEFEPGRTLDLIVFSSKRRGSADRAGAMVTIINESDLTLNIKVLNDDEETPRFNIESIEGEVRFFE